MPTRKVDLKVVLLGSLGAGKTCLVERFVNQRFDAKYVSTIGASFGSKTIQTDGRHVQVGIWDTAGQERYESLVKMYYRGAQAAVLCYDLTNAYSWDRTKFWINEVLQHEENCKIYLCGTKMDLLEDTSRAFDQHLASDYALSIKAKSYETSSKTGENVDELFQEIAQGFIREGNYHDEDDPDVIRVNDNNTEVPFHKRLTSFCCST